MKHLSKTLVLAAFSATVFLQGCTDQEVAIGTGAVVGGVIGAIITDGHNHGGGGGGGRGRGRRCEGAYRTQCNTYRDYYGYVYQECRQVYDGCARYYSSEMDSTAKANLVSEDATVLAAKYQLSYAASEKISYTAEQLSAGNLSVLDGMDLANMTPETLAKQLNVQPAAVEKLVADVQAGTKAQLSDFNSSFWTSCRASGKWSTPQNKSCKQAYWMGCSPETGATFCKAQ